MPDVLLPVLERAFKLALYAVFVAIPTIITRESVARRIRAWTRPQAGAVYGGLAALALLMLYVGGTLRHAPSGAGVWWFFGAGYVGETLLFVRYVRSEAAPGFVRARRRPAGEQARRAG